MNAINVISPYKYLGMWVFDDPRVGLVQEPFVAGADTMIDRVVADIPNASQGFTLIFSASPFPGHQHRLDWQRADAEEGNWYYSEELKLEGWLCPALLLTQILRSTAVHQAGRKKVTGVSILPCDPSLASDCLVLMRF